MSNLPRVSDFKYWSNLFSRLVDETSILITKDPVLEIYYNKRSSHSGEVDHKLKAIVNSQEAQAKMSF